jgi:triacylglycerol lipase
VPVRQYYLRSLGVHVYLSHQDAWAAVEENAGVLQTRIKEILRLENAEKINLIGHSKGGIECCLAAHLFAGEPPIASIITIGTPLRNRWAYGFFKTAAAVR